MMIRSYNYALPMDAVFIKLLNKEILKTTQSAGSSMTILNFRDPDYSPEAGGYHPVEVGINDGAIIYITEFSYVGCGAFSELVKELDFAFEAGVLQQLGRDYPIEQGIELFQMWQQNFYHYYQSGVYQVTVTQF